MTPPAGTAVLAAELPSGRREALLRGLGADSAPGIPLAATLKKPARAEPIGVSLDDNIAALIRRFPRLKFVFQTHRKHRERRIRDLRIPGPERDRLLYQILAIEKASKLQSWLEP
ncbi:MAG: hypothetical protein ACE5HL_05935 [Terriglobia bacterium]